MTPLFKKLNLKENHFEIVILNAPASFQPEMAGIGEKVTVIETLESLTSFSFLLAFVTKQQEVDAVSEQIAEKAGADAVVWFCYPKGSSKKYKCDFNRDTGWATLGNLGFEPVRMVAIDEDWSALRFRKVEHIKTMIRSRALSKEGEIKAGLRKQKD